MFNIVTTHGSRALICNPFCPWIEGGLGDEVVVRSVDIRIKLVLGRGTSALAVARVVVPTADRWQMLAEVCQTCLRNLDRFRLPAPIFVSKY